MLGSSFEVIVVDNASTKGEIEKELKSFPGILLIKSTENIGFGRANNLGFEKSKGDFIFLLNSDAYLVDDSSVPMMLKYLNENEDVGIVGPNFIKADGTKNYAYGNLLGWRKALHDARVFQISEGDLDKYLTFKVCDIERPTAVGYLAAAGILIKREIITRLGLFDPEIFLYFEDMELGMRYAKKGFKSVVIPDAIIVHLGGGSSTQTKSMKELILKSKKYFLKKSLGPIGYYAFSLLDISVNSFKLISKKINLTHLKLRK